MTKVKICGITNLEDALLSAKFGADALGFNFYKKSPRYILPELAREIIDQIPANIFKVGVFVNEARDRIVEVARITLIDAVQLHGDETPEFARKLKAETGLQVMKAFRVSESFEPNALLEYEVDAVLLDTYSPDSYGGTGAMFNWDIAKVLNCQQLYLAGGLNSYNVAAAVKAVRPFAIDVASGVESTKGKKDARKLETFIMNAKSA